MRMSRRGTRRYAGSGIAVITSQPSVDIGQGAVVSIDGGVDALDGRLLDRHFLKLIRESRRYVAVNLARIRTVTEKGLISSLREALSHLRSLGGHLVLYGLRRKLVPAFTMLYGSDELQVLSTEAEAVQALRVERNRINAIPLAERIPGFKTQLKGSLTLTVQKVDGVDRCAIIRCAGSLTERGTTPFWFDLDRVADFGFTRLALDCTRLEWGNVRGASEFCKSFMLNHGGCIALFGLEPMARLLSAQDAMPGCNSFWCDSEAAALSILRRLDCPPQAAAADGGRETLCPRCGRAIDASRPGIHSCAGCGAVVLTDVFRESRVLPDAASA